MVNRHFLPGEYNLALLVGLDQDQKTFVTDELIDLERIRPPLINFHTLLIISYTNF